mgnify:CR=1 FL=1
MDHVCLSVFRVLESPEYPAAGDSAQCADSAADGELHQESDRDALPDTANLSHTVHTTRSRATICTYPQCYAGCTISRLESCSNILKML